MITIYRRVVLCAVSVITLAAPAAAQLQRGVIQGTIHDSSGAVVPGALVQLTSEVSAPRETVAGGRGEYRFQDLDPGRYTLRTTLEGFAPQVRPEVIVGVGTSVEIRVELAVGAVTEELIVNAVSPVLDTRRQGNVTNFDRVMLNEVPTARDPWSLMQHLPGVSIGRPNVGGSESTNQAQFAARGDTGVNTMWNLDGVTITDMAAVGASTTYFDFNLFEEVQFSTGGMDTRQQTGGLGINMVSRRGTSAHRGGARLYYTNDNLQDENISSAQKAAGLSGNRIQQLAEYGGDAGGPLRTDRLWYWAGVSRNDVRQLAINGYPDTGAINTAAARADAQASAATRFSFLFHRGQKVKTGRFAGPERPPETTLDQDGATNIYKAEISQVMGPALFLSGKFAYVDLWFALTPQGGVDAQAYRDFAGQAWHGSQMFSGNDRVQYQTQVDGNWSRRTHDVRFGFQHRHTTADDMAAWPGNGTFTTINLEAQGLPTGVGLATLTRQSAISTETGTVSAYAGDVMTFNRWTFDAGLRFDRQRARNRPSQSAANALAPSILPALDYPGGPSYTWNDWSPRLGATVRLGDRTIARASYARYPSQLGSNVVSVENPVLFASIEYRFADANGDHLAQFGELLGPTGVANGVNPASPAVPFSPNRVDPDVGSPAPHVFVGGVEREVVPGFSLAINVGQSYLSNTLWQPFIGLTRDDFVECRTTACTPTVPTDTVVYQLAPGSSLPPGRGRLMTNRDGYHRRYWNVDLVATRRFADGWMLRGFVTRQQHREFFTGDEGIQDPTARVEQFPQASVSGFVDGGLAMNPVENFLIHTKWIYSVAGVRELPWQMSAAGTLHGRQGYPAAEAFTVNRPGGLGLTSVLVDRHLGEHRFPSLTMLDLRLQKRLAIGRMRATLDLDVFNALNRANTLRQVNEATAATFRNPLEIVAPRLMRLGVQLQF